MNRHDEIQGALVTFPARGLDRPLDGFLACGPRRARRLLIFVHGMHSNFYRSEFKKELMRQGPARGVDVLSFNNRGAELGVETERFADSLHDLDAAIAFGRSRGYRRFVLMGHSTGCQKITYWQFRRRRRSVEALVLAAIGDDLAIFRRELGRRFFQRLETARRWRSQGWKNRPMPDDCKRFTAQRFLSVAEARQIEARLFDFDGPMREFAAVRTPILALFPEREEYACLPVPEMMRRLAARTRSRRFTAALVRGANHGFKGAERRAVAATLEWLGRGRRTGAAP